jgi:hypothetical protein
LWGYSLDAGQISRVGSGLDLGKGRADLKGGQGERGGGCEKAGKGKSGQSRTSCHRLGLALLGVQRGLGGEDSFWWRVEAGFGM